MHKYYFTVIAIALILAVLSSCCPIRECSIGIETDITNRMQSPASNASQLKSRPAMEFSDQFGTRIKQQIIDTIKNKQRISAFKDDDSLPLKVLVLSGGGPKGAYGAGFLNGLKNAPSSSEKDFDYDIVTGISTGSIQSSFAFLGPEYFHILSKIYTDEEWDTFVPKKPLISLLFCGNSLRRTDLFKKKLKEYVTDEIIDTVAQRGADNLRRLYIGTVDLDSGLFIRWDMVEIAKSKKYDEYRNVILAACAIPVIFPPVSLVRQVEGVSIEELHVDGGARHMAFIKQNMLDIRDAIRAIEQKVDPTIYVLLNNSLYPNKICAQNKVLNIATRAASTLMKQSIENDVFRAYMIACFNQMQFRITFMDSDITDFEDDFYPDMRDDMRRVYKEAYEKAESNGWHKQLPDGENWEEAEELCHNNS